MESPALSPSPPQPWRRCGFGIVRFVVCTAAGLAAVRGRIQWSEARAVPITMPWWTLAVGMTQVVSTLALLVVSGFASPPAGPRRFMSATVTVFAALPRRAAAAPTGTGP